MRAVQIIFFCLPFFIFLGIAIQAIAFYTLGLALPAFYFLYTYKKPLPRFFLKIGSALIFLHLLFPLFNVVNLFFPDKSVDARIYQAPLLWSKFLLSAFPSSFLIGGLALVLFYAVSQKLFGAKGQGTERSGNEGSGPVGAPLKYFLMGLCPASFVFFAVFFYQHATGIDLRSLFRAHIEYLDVNDMFSPAGGFRIYGFYGHPLSIAGACLAYFTFLWGLLYAYFSQKNTDAFWYLPFYKNRWYVALFLGSTAIAHLLLIVLSGGRTALAVALALLFLIPVGFYINKGVRRLGRLALVLGVMLVCVTLFVKKFHILNRMEAATTAVVQNKSFEENNNRLYFWNTYAHIIAERPWTGEGYYWLKNGVREEYYERLGFGTLKEKFAAHNMYLEVLGCLGVVGTGLLIWGGLKLCRAIRKDVGGVESERTMGDKEKTCSFKACSLKIPCFAWGLAFVANALHGLTQNVFFDSSVCYIYLEILVVLVWSRVAIQKVFAKEV